MIADVNEKCKINNNNKTRGCSHKLGMTQVVRVTDLGRTVVRPL